MPDHLPVLLEFLSAQPLAEGRAILAEAAHILAALPDRLARRYTPYSAVLRALTELAAAPPDAEARAALATLARDPAAFEHMARALSACPSREAGGRLGQVAAGDTVPEFEAALDALAEGENAAEPVATRYGLHVIRLDAKAEGRVPPFEAVAPAIRAQLEKTAWARAARALTARLIAGAAFAGVDFPQTA